MNPSAGWHRRAPKLVSERRDLKARCGSRCFLAAKNGFPVCQKLSVSHGACVVDCGGTEAAYARAKQYGHSHVAAKALQVGRRAGCGWARRHG